MGLTIAVLRLANRLPVRSHLHSIHRKLGVADRAQAVLLATDRGWL